MNIKITKRVVSILWSQKKKVGAKQNKNKNLHHNSRLFISITSWCFFFLITVIMYIFLFILFILFIFLFILFLFFSFYTFQAFKLTIWGKNSQKNGRRKTEENTKWKPSRKLEHRFIVFGGKREGLPKCQYWYSCLTHPFIPYSTWHIALHMYIINI